MKDLTKKQESELNKMASIGQAGSAILNAAKLNSVSVKEVTEICLAMALKYEKEEK